VTSKHREFQKNYTTQILFNGKTLQLNHFTQETLANMIIGFLKTLKDAEEPEKTIQIKIKKLAKTSLVDAHTYQ